MFWLYLILGIIAGILLILVVLALIAPRSATVERTIIVNVPPEKTFDYLRSFQNFEQWSPWSKRDPDMQHGIRGTDGELGAVHWWNGNKDVGEGEQEINRLEPHSHIGMELRFVKPFKATNQAWLKLNPVGDGTEVKWGFHAEFKPPMNIMMLFMNLDKAVGGDYKTGLAAMKQKIEA